VEEIRKLVEYPDHRIKPIVYTMISSGIRLGAWDFLKWKHVKPKREENTGKLLAAELLVYAGEPEEYITFISPQAYNALKKYMDFRASYGEQINPNSPIIRNIFRTADVKRIKENPLSNGGGTVGLVTAPKRLRSLAIKKLLIRAQVEQGIRFALPDGVRRHEWKGAHGFRKFFETYAEAAGVKTSFVKILMAHSQGVEDSYNKPTTEILLHEYCKAVPKLTILSSDDAAVSSTLQLQKQVSELKEKNKEENWQAEQQKKQMQTMAQQLETMKREHDGLQKLIMRVFESVAPDDNNRSVLVLRRKKEEEEEQEQQQNDGPTIDTETIIPPPAAVDATTKTTTITPKLPTHYFTPLTEFEALEKKKEEEKYSSEK
jgi:hypothetical protein